MTREEIIQGLQFTIDMFLSDPLTGEALEKPRNDMDKTTIDACKGAIELLTQEPCEDAINREEAIDAVAGLFEMSEYPHPYSQGKPIRLKDIKEKLKQLPPVQPKLIECEDAISRQDALDALHMCLGTNSYDDDVTGDSYICYEEAEYEIEKLPSVQPKPKVGHWIFDEILDRNYYCSECKSMGVDYWDYCPYCGCRMIEPQESENGNEL